MLEHSQIKVGESHSYVIVLPEIKSLIISNVKYKIVHINRAIGLVRMEYKNIELWKYIGSAKEMFWFKEHKELKEFINLKRFSSYERSYLIIDTMTNDIIAVEKE